MGLRDRLKEEAAKAKANATEKAREVGAGAGEKLGPRLTALVKMDEDQPLTPETFLLKLVEAIRRDERRELSDKDVKKKARRRQRVAGGIGTLGGLPGLHVASLYCEAALLCDVAELHGLELSNEQLASHLLVLWNAMPDLAAAEAAIAGTGDSVVARMAIKFADKVGLKPREEMTKKDTVKMLWGARGVVEDVATPPEGAGPRDIVLPGKRVKAITAAAEQQLGVA